jgi:methyl-accepting chemotaxis protein
MLVCLAVAIIPLGALSLVMWQSAEAVKDATAAEYEAIASNVGDKIDRNLFERYGDVQAFGLNSVATDESLWYQKGESNPIVQAMNQYVDTYDIYFFTLLVDLEGKLIAVNTRDDSGGSVDTGALYAKDFSREKWFKDAIAERFYESADGSFTGTVVEHLYVDEDVASVYGDEGLSLGFSAPVKNKAGEVVAIWKNVAKFSLVEEIVSASYAELAGRGLGAAEITLLDEHGNVIVDCDPTLRGSVEVKRDMEIIGKFNLAEKGVESAVNVVAGESGSLKKSWHARKEVFQTAGYSPLSGALGFPGMKWNVLVRLPQSVALASANQLQRSVWISFLFAFALVTVGSYWLARTISNVIKNASDSLHAAASKDYSHRVESKLCTDTTKLTTALNGMLDSLEDYEAKASDYEGQIEAISKSQAVIEFDMDGTIRSANENFLAAVGYTLDEIKGKHHRIFVRSEEASSPEYREFWERLNAGQFDASEYQWFGKDGKEIWIQASYNPITDVNGKPVKVVNYALDITDQVNGRREQEARDRKVVEYQENEVVRVSSLMAEIAKGDLQQNYVVTECEPETEAVHATFTGIANALNNMCSNLREVIGNVSLNASKLTSESTSLSSTATQLSAGADSTMTQSATVAAAAEEMATNMKNMSGSTEMMTSNVNSVAKSVEELTSSISEIAKTAEQSSAIAGQAASLTQSSNATIAELGSAAEEIGKVIEVIQDIAEQTNLLALNATIEAARAGEAGKGFAVVATEVKELARQTAGATEDIRNRIQVIQGSTTEAVRAIQEVGDVIEKVNQTSATIASAVEEQSILTQGIATNINDTAEQTTTVSTGVAESATACDEIARNIVGVDKAARQTAQGATETESIGGMLADLSSELQTMVGQFKIDATPAANRPVPAPSVNGASMVESSAALV